MMMKRFFAAALIVACSAAAFAQEEPQLKLSGEAKTGVYWQQTQLAGQDAETKLKIHSRDDAGGDIDNDRGRFRLNMDFDNGKNVGMRARLQWQNWGGSPQTPDWNYAFGYGNFFEEQMTVSIGKLGGSSWGTGGPEKWKELENTSGSNAQGGGGIRIEWKPAFIPVGKLNTGFVLNWYDGYDEGTKKDVTLIDLLRESVLGLAYTHDYFLVRFAYRLDSELDVRQRGQEHLHEGDALIFRLEEHIIGEYVPGLQMWAIGDYVGVGAQDEESVKMENWVFAQYDPPELGELVTPFTAQLRFGYDRIFNRSELHVKPSFYWHFFDKLLSVGALFSYRQDFDHKLWDGSPYQVIELEPKIQLNFASSYIAFAYNWKREYKNSNDYPGGAGRDPILQTQYMNLRFCIYY